MIHLFNALCNKASTVEDVLDVCQPTGDCQAAHPLVVRGRDVTAGLHQLGVGILDEIDFSAKK